MPKYRVLAPGYYADILRTPGGKHDPVETAMPIPEKELPSWLEPIENEPVVAVQPVDEPTDPDEENLTPQQKAARTRAANKAAAEEAAAKKEGLDFSGNDDDVQTL